MATPRKRYSEDFKRQLVARVDGDPSRVAVVAGESGVPRSTLHAWCKRPVEPDAPSPAEVELPAVKPPDPADNLRLRQSLLETAFALNAAIRESTASAPLNQLSAALGLIIDRLLKLEALTSGADNAPDSVDAIRIEYSYPDGSVHSRPPWAADDPAFDLPVVRGHVRSPFWESRDAEQADDPGAGPAPA